MTKQEIKHILQIHLDVNIISFFHPFLQLLYRQIHVVFPHGSALQLHSQVLLNPVIEQRKSSRYMMTCKY